MDKPTCETCPYFLQNEDDCGLGNCHKHTPWHVVCNHGHDSWLDGQWPEISPDAFCGEHPDFPAWIESRRKPRRVSKDEVIVVDPIKVTNG